MPNFVLSPGITFGGPPSATDPQLPTGSELNDRVLAWIRTRTVWGVAVNLGRVLSDPPNRTVRDIAGVVVFAFTMKEGKWQPAGFEAFQVEQAAGVVAAFRTSGVMRALSNLAGEVSYTDEEWAKLAPMAKAGYDRLRFLCLKHRDATGQEIIDVLNEQASDVKAIDDEMKKSVN